MKDKWSLGFDKSWASGYTGRKRGYIMSQQITEFRGTSFFLSNFWLTPIEWKGETFKSVEHAYQALKTDDAEWRNRIKNAYYPMEARRIGRCIPRNLLRPGWDDVRLKVMSVLIKKKFSQPALQALLLKTGDAEIIHENNWNDTFFGVCNGKGENHLGVLLMDIRKTLQDAAQEPLPVVEPPKPEEPKHVVKARRRPSEPCKAEPAQSSIQPEKTLLELATGLTARKGGAA